jgi:PKD repeat protein
LELASNRLSTNFSKHFKAIKIMKQKLTIYYLLALLCGAMTVTSCEKDDDNKTATTVTADFEISPVGAGNVVTFTNKSTGHASSAWNFGDENTSNSNEATVAHTYPIAGTYHVTLTVTASDGTQASKQKDVVIEQSDLSGLLTPTVLKLIGSNHATGTTWVLDQWNNYTAKVAGAIGKSIKGHIGLGPLDSYSSDWWGAGPNEKTNAGWRIYEETFKFSLGSSALELAITNPGGRGYGRLKNDISKSKFSDATAWLDPNNNTPSDAEAEFTYAGGTYTFNLTEPTGAGENDYPKLTLTGNAFLGYYVGTQEYDILYLTDSVLAVRAADPNDGTDNFDWVFIFIRPELNIEPEVPEKTLAEVAYPVDGFEGTPAFTVTVDVSAGSSGIVDNPSKSGINTSNKVYKFEKTADFWSHVFYLDEAHKFNLSAKNKVKVKVYIPSTNDYDTEGSLAGDWLTIKKLQKQLVVKLQDNDLGGNSYTTQVEKTHADLALDTWTELTFDFSDVSTRTDFDKIIIQFGQEGHNRTGTFYFDDLQFFVE